MAASIRDESFFPKEITRIGKIQTGDIVADFERLQQKLELLYLNGKPKKAKGYNILIKKQKFPANRNA